MIVEVFKYRGSKYEKEGHEELRSMQPFTLDGFFALNSICIDSIYIIGDTVTIYVSDRKKVIGI